MPYADTGAMPNDLQRILRLEVPLRVLIAERRMSLSEVTALTHGSIIELPKQIDEELEVHVNETPIGRGRAVKVGENFGVRLTSVGPVAERVQALLHYRVRDAFDLVRVAAVDESWKKKYI